jgi:hypothetical protein
MLKLAWMLVTAASIVFLTIPAHEAGAQLVVSCGGTVQNCPKGKKMYCNRWKACKGKKPKAAKYCADSVCMFDREGAKE